jgi:hypothetical protein
VKKRGQLTLFVALLAVVIGFSPAWAAQHPRSTRNQVQFDGDPTAADTVTSIVDAGSADAVTAIRKYWTDNSGKNMNQAVQMTMPLFTGPTKSAPAPSLRSMAGPAGPTMIVSGSQSGRVAPKVQFIPAHLSLRGTEVPPPMAGDFPFSFTRYRLFPNTDTMYRTYPYRTVGKLFFNIGTSRFVCSASVVTAANFSVVWTAGHCVFSPGFGFHSNFLFVPAQRKIGTVPNSPFGEWTAFTATTLAGWTNGLLEYDHGALVMNRGGLLNSTVGETVGMLGFMADAPRNQHWHLFGYPQAPQAPPSIDPQFDGFHQEICASTWAADDQPTGGPADPMTIGVGCDSTGGTSGGPWIVDFNSTPTTTSGGTPVVLNLLNGNNSYRYGGGAPNSLRLFGPYFTTGAIALREFAENIDVP